MHCLFKFVFTFHVMATALILPSFNNVNVDSSTSLPEIRFLSFAPSSYTRRFDTVRAGLGISLHLQNISTTLKMPVKITFFNGTSRLPTLGGSGLDQLFQDANIIMIGGETWDVGSTQYLRSAFEKADIGASLIGGACTAWACSGGSYTGGEMVIMDTLRSLMAYGCEVFQPLAQRHVVFTTDERVGAGNAGEFTLLDSWLMQSTAQRLLVRAYSKGDSKQARELAIKVGWSPYYYKSFPSLSDLNKMHEVVTVRTLINDASSLTNTQIINEIASKLDISTDEITP